MKTQRTADLLFLFGLTAAAVGGCDADDGDSDSATASATATSGASDVSGGPSSSSTGASTAPPTSGDAGDPCAAIAERSVECESDTDYDTALDYCADTFAYLDATYGGDCVAAYEDVLACVLTLDCKSFNAEPRTGCPAEQQAFEAACGFAGGESTSSGGGTTTDGSTSGG